MILANVILGAGIINLILGIIIVLGGYDKKKTLPFAFFAFSSFLLSVADYFIYETRILFFDRLAYAFGVMIPTFLLAWIYNYSMKNPKRSVNFLIYLTGLLFSALSILSDFIIYDIRENPTVGLVDEKGSLFFLYIAFYVFSYASVLAGLLYSLIKSNVDIIKNQAKVILIGFFIYGSSAIFFGLILPVFGYEKLVDFDVVVSVIFVAFTTYAIAQYKWMDIKVIAVQLLALLITGISFVEIFVADSFQMIIYKTLVFLSLSIVSYLLVKSVMSEIRRKEELQIMADKLATANDQLRKLDNAKTEFISIASHQLRTPLTSVKGFISLIIEGSYGEINAGVRDALTKVYASSERLIQLVEDLLNVSRIESGRMQFTFEKGNIAEMMQELYDNFMLVAKNKDLYLDIKLPKQGLPEVTMDPSKVREVISNFTDNALKYTEKGGVTMKAEETKEKTVKITISDTGIGVPADEMQYLFKKFSRGKDTGRLHAGGTGLGLYVGKNIVDAHHGKVWVESDGEGKGSRFIIELPIEQPAV